MLYQYGVHVGLDPAVPPAMAALTSAAAARRAAKTLPVALDQ